MTNPTIEELQNSDNFELIAQLNHKQIKEFVMEQIANGGNLVKAFMIYQVVMIVVGIFFFIHSIILLFQGISEPIYYSLGALLFSFSFLIVIHELLHGAALKFIGAKNIHFGGYLKKFIFYAEADQFVMNRKQFKIIALAPLIIVKLITLAGILLFLSSPWIYSFIIIMSVHSLFCAGDIGLISIFNIHEKTEIFTYDVRAQKTSYFYKKNSSNRLNELC